MNEEKHMILLLLETVIFFSSILLMFIDQIMLTWNAFFLFFKNKSENHQMVYGDECQKTIKFGLQLTQNIM